MTKYHINKATGEIGECHATVGSCHFGSPEEHYPSITIAQQVYEYSMNSEMFSNTMSKKKKDIFEDSGMTPFNQNDYDTKFLNFCKLLTKNEQEALSMYVYSGYMDINNYLSGEHENQRMYSDKGILDNWVRNIDSALSKAPKERKLVWRTINNMSSPTGDNLVENFLKKVYKVGDVIESKGYVSTACCSSKATQYMLENEEDGLKNIVFEISTENGAAVSGFRGETVEAEVLLPRNSKFRIVGTEEKKEFSAGPGARKYYAKVYKLEEIH